MCIARAGHITNYAERNLVHFFNVMRSIYLMCVVVCFVQVNADYNTLVWVYEWPA